MKKHLSVFVSVLVILLMLLPVNVLAADGGRAYQFELSVNNQNSVEAMPGDIITVMLRLARTDATDASMMYAMQSEVQYDARFFELVDNSMLPGSGIEMTMLHMRDGSQRVYMNFVSMSGGTNWPADVIVGSFQLKVLAESGTSVVSNQDYLVSTKDGSSRYEANSTDLQVVITKDATVHFDPNGGTEVPDQTVNVGGPVAEPPAPSLEGHDFEGWYRDIDLTDEWNFEEDTVSGNTDLYGDWSVTENIGEGTVPLAGLFSSGNIPYLLLGLAALLLVLLAVFLLMRSRKKTVVFETNGGTPVRKMRVKKGETLMAPAQPQQEGAEFGGWYKDKGMIVAWNFDSDTVKRNVTLYAKWNKI